MLKSEWHCIVLVLLWLRLSKVGVVRFKISCLSSNVTREIWEKSDFYVPVKILLSKARDGKRQFC